MIDTHSHINFDEYKENFDDFLRDIKNNDVEKVIIPGVEPSTFSEIIQYTEKYDMLYGAIGIHPSEFQTFNEESEKNIYELAKNKKIIAIGEIGLDYHYGADTKEQQKNIFSKQLEIARELNLPVIIHDREAHDDTFNILKNFKLKNVIFHCFSGSPEFAEKCINAGYYIGIGGVVTFKNAIDLKESTKIIPIEKILLETDAPYLAPVPFRGKINTPAYLKYIAQEIADLKGIDVEEVKYQTAVNSKRVFNF
ncbi:MAG: TatD family hydrolase [Candidatus Gastranaerophilales bacterium]|nr:TatD family hydrolase [Candidatus Gastranaerophilales bacterium]